MKGPKLPKSDFRLPPPGLKFAKLKNGLTGLLNSSPP